MAIRVRKLAKELNRSPTEVLGVLHAIGFTRFRNVNDMLSDQIVSRLKKAIRNHVEPVSIQTASTAVRANQGSEPSHKEQVYSESDLDLTLSQLLGESSVEEEVAPTEQPVNSTAAVTEKHEALLGEIQRLTLENERLEALFKRAIVDLDALKEREEKRIQTMESFTELGSVLRDRGLESERELGAGIQAIAHLKPVEQWLSHLYVKEGAGFSDWVAEKVCLVSSDSPSLVADGFAPVVVPIDRAEQLGDAALQQAVHELSELFLLFGLRRVLIIGDMELYSRPLRQHMDARIQPN